MALNGNIAVASTSDGTITTYRQSASSSTWRTLPTLPVPRNQTASTSNNNNSSSSINNIRFGASLALSPQGLAVGAPTDVGSDGQTRGAVYAYQFNSLSNQWTLLGSTIYGTTTMGAQDEHFGASVAMATSSKIVVVGAPQSNQSSGAIYAFDYMAVNNATAVFDWQPMVSTGTTIRGQPLGQGFANDALGTSVDISADGTMIVAGAPGTGYVVFYEWSPPTSSWLYLTRLDAPSFSEAFGSTVVFLSPSGNVFAVGSPQHQNGQGSIRVYAILNGQTIQLGGNIVGDAKDFLGYTGTVSGSYHANGTSILAGTAGGMVKRYDYIATSNTWEQKFQTVNAGFVAAVSGVSANDGSTTFMVGSAGSDKVVFYDVAASAAPSPISNTQQGSTGSTMTPTLTSTMASTVTSSFVSSTGQSASSSTGRPI